MRARFAKRAREHTKSVAAIMSNMTVSSALQVLHKSEKAQDEPQYLGLVEEALQGQTTVGSEQQISLHSHLRVVDKSSALRGGNFKDDYGNKQAQPDKGYAGVDKAKNMLNEMIEETQVKYDNELNACCEFDEMQSLLIEEARQDISTFNAVSAEARKDVLEAETMIHICSAKLPELHDALAMHSLECKEGEASLRSQLIIISEDLNVMDHILKMTQCDNSASALMLMKCTDSCTGEAFVSFAHEKLALNASSFQSAHFKKLVAEGLAEVFKEGQESLNMTNNFTTYKPLEVPDRQITRSGPCKEPKSADKRTGKCSMNRNPNCPKMQEKFQYIQAGIEDKRDELQEQLAKQTHDCVEMTFNLESQIGDFESKLKDEQTALAIGTKMQNQAEGQSRLKNDELQGLHAKYAEETEKCHTNYETLESEDCGLKKIRGELYKMQGPDNPAFFQDCVVAEWRPGECSATCGGGAIRLTRSIVTPPVGGAKCPVLEALQPCNPQKCPVDCILSDWQGWSQCTAKCGGGIMQRERAVDTEPAHGGEPCGETSEAVACNLVACDQDCELSDWTEWSACSKECDDGTSQRVKTIAVPVVGDGHCPAIRSEDRIQEMSCNAVACVKANPSPTLQCQSKLDVILVIDGSGSLGQKGWDASIKAGAMIARAMSGTDNQVELAVLLFSLTSDWVTHYTKKSRRSRYQDRELAVASQHHQDCRRFEHGEQRVELGSG
jgi:hypothetical protein